MLAIVYIVTSCYVVSYISYSCSQIYVLLLNRSHGMWIIMELYVKFQL